MAKAKKKAAPKKAAPAPKKVEVKEVVKEVVKETPAKKKYEIPVCKHEETKKVRNHRNVMIVVCADCGIRV